MRNLLFFIFTIIPLPLYATSGEPSFVTDVYFDKAKGKVVYIEDWGYGHTLYSIQIDSNKHQTVTVFDEDRWGAFQNKKKSLERFYQPLKEIDLRKKGLSFTATPKSIPSAQATFRKESYEAELLNWEEYGEIISWNTAAYYKNKEVGNGQFQACSGTDAVKFRGYSSPDINFIVIVTSTRSNCYEGGYTGETAFLIKDMTVLRNEILSEPTNITDYDYDEGRTGAGTTSIPLSDHTLSSFINDHGMEAYHAKKYKTALSYFSFAHAIQSETNDYLLPLYNAACTYSLLGETDKAFTALAELLSNERSRERYQRKIKKDKDFDNIRGDSRYMELFEIPPRTQP